MKKSVFPSIPPETDQKVVSEWLDIIKRRECGIIVFPPKGDAYRRIQHLVTWTNVLKKRLGADYRKNVLVECSANTFVSNTTELFPGWLLSKIDINKKETLSVQECVKALQPVLKEVKSISFLLYETDDWFSKSRTDLLLFMSELSELEPRIQFLLFCEMNIASEHFLKLNIGSTTLVQNILTVPLYDREAILYFVHELGKYWSSVLPEEVVEAILAQIGCHTWIVKEAVRLYIKEHKIPENYNSKPTIRFKLESIWQQLSNTEKNVLLKVIRQNHDFAPDERTSLSHLIETGMVEKIEDTYKLTMPVFSEYIKEKAYSMSLTLGPEGSVLLDNQNVTNRFGALEKRALVCLLKKQGNLVNREELGEAVWINVVDSYSDWALDRIVSRLRKKIKKLNVDADRLVTHKKAGWLWKY